MDIKTPKHSWLQNPSSKLTLQAVAVSVVVTILFISADLEGYVFRKHVYDQVQLGMPGAIADHMLLANGVFCESAQMQRYHECVFEDFWRVYRIGFAEPEYVVVNKRMIFKRHDNSLITKVLPRIWK